MSKKEYRDAILFDEIMNTEKIILIYDTLGKPFRHEAYKNWGAIFLCIIGFVFIYYNESLRKYKFLPYLIPAGGIIGRLKYFRQF